MSADCEQTRGRLLELVYGELPDAERAQVQAHLAGCADCRAELAALESTRTLARRALETDAPPPRAHAAILRAAAAAVPARVPAPAVPPRPSFWSRLRSKWTLPTFATVGAVAVFLLASRIFLEPQKTYERGRQGLAPAASSAPAVESPPPPAGAAAPEPPPEEARDQAASDAKPARAVAKKRRATSAAANRLAPAAPSTKDRAEPALEAAPPPAAAAPQRAFAPRPPAKRAEYDFQDDMFEGGAPANRGAGSGAAAPRAKAEAAPRAPAKPAVPRSAPAADDDDRAAALYGSTADEDEAKPAGHQPPAARADLLFTRRRWAEAAVAYRALLRDDPRNPDAPRWRQRLAACEAASRPDR